MKITIEVDEHFGRLQKACWLKVMQAVEDAMSETQEGSVILQGDFHHSEKVKAIKMFKAKPKLDMKQGHTKYEQCKFVLNPKK